MKNKMIKLRSHSSRFYLSLFLFSASIFSSQTADTIDTSQPLTDIANATVVSSAGAFALGFFSPGNSKNRYVGIWYNKIKDKTVVWIANRDAPLTDGSGMLRLVGSGRLLLLNSTNATVWSTNSSTGVANPIAQLLDSGNLVVRDANDENPKNYLWQSFDFPSDTFLPGMKLGRNFRTGLEVYIASAKSNDDPATGSFTYHCDPSGYPQTVIKEGSSVRFKTGPWNGVRFSGSHNLVKNNIFTFGVVINEDEVYYHYQLLNDSVYMRFVITEGGVGQRWLWSYQTENWILYLTIPTDNCDIYSVCGANGICDTKTSTDCSCLDKFEPKDPRGWGGGDFLNGCVRRTPFHCQNGDGFLKYSGVKLPDTERSWHNSSMTLQECKVECTRNCSCTAYASLDISRGESGCLLWFGDLVDMREAPPGPRGQDIYIRMAKSELGSGSRKRETLIATLSVVMGTLLLGISLLLYYQKRKKSKLKLEEQESDRLRQTNADTDKESHEEMELPMFELPTIIKATDDFSPSNKLGEGGFGQVYKGLLEGQEIAVKRLSRSSLQGVCEFKNEVICIAKLQHRNLVKLLGCCIHGEERILVYEYMTNKSLDLILFDKEKRLILDWPRRFNIINGIARGLMYLHQDSRLRVIHRDLKASNILLDSDMTPKISDFGLAKTLGGNETGANTSRVVGTYGYMSPEYAVDGMFSVKSDVFSFGVLVLEIISGKKNRGFSQGGHSHNLLGHAWMLYKEERSMELVDPCLECSSYLSQVVRSIHVGLLCVQEHVDERPNMSSVVLMLNNDGVLPEANQPGFFTGRDVIRAETSNSSNTASSASIFSSQGADTIDTSQTLTVVDNGTVVSSTGAFALGFFSPGNSKNRYVGIWYNKIKEKTVVWIANKDNPLTDSSGALRLVDGRLLLLNSTNATVWSTNSSISVADPIVQLLDLGNLVVRDANDENPNNYLWQSFDFPSDTFLPGMKLGRNFRTGLEVYITSVKNSDDPATGGFTYHYDPSGYPQTVIKEGSSVRFKTGPWNGVRFSGSQNLVKNTIFSFGVVINEDEVYYHYQLLNDSVYMRFVLTEGGVGQRWLWSYQTENWILYLTIPTDNCDIYRVCGAYGICNTKTSPDCSCLDKFEPKDPQGWAGGSFSNGCVRRTPFHCQNGDGFLKYSGVKLPDTEHSLYNSSMSLEECKVECTRNCSCTAYAS